MDLIIDVLTICETLIDIITPQYTSRRVLVHGVPDSLTGQEHVWY
jgi:hypothetical protein